LTSVVLREGVGEADIGLALGDAAAEVAAGVFAAAEPDEDDHVQRSVGCAVAGEVDPVAFGAPTGCGNRSGRAQVGERRLRAEPVDVLADGDEQGRGVVGAASQTRRGRGRCGCVEFVSEFGGFGAEAGDAMAQVAQCWVGGLGGTGEPVLVGPQPGGRRSLSLEGPAAVELGAHLDLFTGDMGTDVARLDEVVGTVNGEGQLSHATPDQVLGRIVGDHERAVRIAASYVGTRGWRHKLYFHPGVRARQGRDSRQRDPRDDGGHGYDDATGQSLVPAGNGTTEIRDVFGDRLHPLQGIPTRIRDLEPARIAVEQLDVELALELIQPAGNRGCVYVERLGGATYGSRPGKCLKRSKIVPMEVRHDWVGPTIPEIGKYRRVSIFMQHRVAY